MPIPVSTGADGDPDAELQDEEQQARQKPNAGALARLMQR